MRIILAVQNAMMYRPQDTTWCFMVYALKKPSLKSLLMYYSTREYYIKLTILYENAVQFLPQY